MDAVTLLQHEELSKYIAMSSVEELSECIAMSSVEMQHHPCQFPPM